MKVLVTDGMAPEAVKILEDAGHEVVLDEVSPEGLLEKIGGYDALIVRSRTKVKKEAIERAEKLMVIGRAGIGVDNIDIEAAADKGVKVVNAPTGSTLSVAELAFGHMLSLARGIHRGTGAAKKGEWMKKKLKGMELHGKTLGIVGCGRIGRELAKRCQAFGMDVIGCDPYIPCEVADEACIELLTMEELLKRADFVSIHAYMSPENHHMIGKEELEMMKSSAYLINCARGGLVDEEALYEALKKGEIAGAGLDTYETEPPGEMKLAELDNVTFTPHIGANTVDAQRKAGTLVAEQVNKVLSKEMPDFWVNKR